VSAVKLIVLLLLFEIVYFHTGETRNLEMYLGGWIIVYISLILFTAFNVHGRPYGTGNVGNNFTYLSIDKIEKLFKKPKRGVETFDTSLLLYFILLFAINLVIYLILFVF